MSTILLKNGTVIDGTGRAGFAGHVIVDGDTIAGVIPKGTEPPQTDLVIDAEGCVVCPGFIDMHSHADWVVCLEENPDMLGCLLEQGITSVVAGNCGFSPAPIRQETFGRFQQFMPLMARMPSFSWEGMGQFLDRVQAIGPCVNVAELTGHASIRFAAGSAMRGRMSGAELQQGLDLLAGSLDQGSCGLSLGLGYEPGMYSPLDELEAFCRVAREKDKPVTVHLKALSALSPTYPLTTLEAHNLLALKEMLGVARATGVKLQLSHFIFVGRNSFWTEDKAIRMVELARNDGVDVMFDAFPYTCGNTTISVVLPHWFLKRAPEAYRNPWLKLRLRIELETGFRLVGFMYNDFQVMTIDLDGYEDLQGLRVTEIARKWGTTPFEALLRLCALGKWTTVALFHAYSGVPGREEALNSVLSHDLCLFETDAITTGRGYPNPAAMGTFPRLCGPLVREGKLFTLEQAVHRSTHASAKRFGITDRGIVQKGKAADLVVFDPDTISDTPPSGAKPAGRPAGIRHVLVNGKQAVKDGAITAELRAGRVLRV
ncbi:MAG: amidohydrolase family protein [Desulfobacterota bacterium]|nr:amidohydrolase family protein [Thermodesulfobacteriota bacterium]